LALNKFQQLVDQVKDITGLDNGIMEITGSIIASTILAEVDNISPFMQQIIESRNRVRVFNGRVYQKVYVKNKFQFVAFIEDKGDESLKYLSLLSLNISNLKEFYEDKYNKSSFMKDIVLGNISPGEILQKSKALHMEQYVNRVVYLIKTNKSKEIFTYEILQSLFPNKSKDFVMVLDEETTVLIREVKSEKDRKSIVKLGQVMIDTLNTELMVQAYVGVGSVVESIMDLEYSYQSANIALTIGRIFESDKHYYDYNNLGIGRLIYEVPKHLCKVFLDEVFKENDFEGFDSETNLTIQKFFENSLNISETSRQLYIHRNTLVYRLDKIQKMTGLDLRRFDDAIILKISMLVRMFLERSENNHGN